VKNRIFWRPLFCLGLLCSAAARPARAADAPEPSALEFFERRIRPVLIDNCYKCHSKDSEKVKGGLLLDTRDALLKGGDSGPAIVPGDPEKSLLIKAVRYTDEELKMPPKSRKLPAGQIADLEAWIKMGAPDPRTGQEAVKSGPPLSDPEKVRTHWAFQPVKDPAVPAVKNKKWALTPLDAFVMAKLEARKMTPAKPADRRTLIRRATFDLTGLPPTMAEVEAFQADKSPEAFTRVIDRLLASPQYGERWGRHWLDVARYADTKGYLAGDEQRRYPYSYTYRDYVIRAFNEDLPYDQFLIQQIAADLLPLGDDRRPLAALGFLTLGRRFLNNVPDIIDDRIDVVTRGTMGLTVACARCHDHKYDPIPTKDYYSLYGVFDNSHEPNDKPLLGVTPPEKIYQEYLAEKKRRQDELDNFRQSETGKQLAEARKKSAEYLLAAHDAKDRVRGEETDKLAKNRKLEPVVLHRWLTSLDGWAKSAHPIFAPWFAFAALPEEGFAEKAKELAAQFAANGDASKPLNPLVAKIFAGEPPASLKEVSERYGKLLAGADKTSVLPEANEEALRQVLFAVDAPANVPAAEQDGLLEGVRPRLRQLKAKIDEVDAVHPGAPPRAMALADNASFHNPVVFVRGNPGNRGPEVPRQFPAVLAGGQRRPFQKGSGRLELAQAIASGENPLTARVIVNRVWLQHFGAGLVRTPSDFGLRADPPTHPELLDWLASRFVEDGWSLKKLHRRIMLSAVYQQGSDDRADYVATDPANFWLWKMNRQRLSFEELRDTLLAVSGKLDLSAGGLPVEITTEPFTPRRTVYGLIDRQNLPGVFRTFDFASPDTTSAQRFNTTVPQQSLFLMNSPFVMQQVRALTERPEFQAAREDERIRFLFALAYQRAPGADELKIGRQFVQAQKNASPESLPVAAGWHYGYGEFDETAKQVTGFHPLPHFTGSAWQGGGQLPDATLGWVMLNAEGGHVGNDRQHAAVRRWVAPRDGSVQILGTLAHATDKGDGVRGFLVSSRAGELGRWTVHNDKAATQFDKVEVKAGDTIDFLTDLGATVENDSFTWAPKIKYLGAATRPRSRLAADQSGEWNAETDFGQPGREQPKPLDPWQKYAQVLLLSNELAFVD